MIPGDPELSAALRAALDVILLLRFRVFLVSRRSWNDQFLLLNLVGSLWLMLLQTVPSKRNLRLLRLFGTDPWVFGWQRLEQAPCLYVIFPYPVQCSCHGPLFYVDETILFRRRMLSIFFVSLPMMVRPSNHSIRLSGATVPKGLSCLPPLVF